MPKPFLIEIDGQKKSIRGWAKFYGKNHYTVTDRIQAGWEPREALETPGGRYKSRLVVNGEERTMESWAKRAGLPVKAIQKRLERGWSPEQAIQPRKRKAGGVTALGRTQTLKEWSEESGIPENTLYNRINSSGLSLEVALKLPIAKQGRRGKRKQNDQ